MTRERISQIITALMGVLGVLAAADPELVPMDIARWIMLAMGAVAAVASAFGFNTPVQVISNPDRRDQ